MNNNIINILKFTNFQKTNKIKQQTISNNWLFKNKYKSTLFIKYIRYRCCSSSKSITISSWYWSIFWKSKITKCSRKWIRSHHFIRWIYTYKFTCNNKWWIRWSKFRKSFRNKCILIQWWNTISCKNCRKWPTIRFISFKNWKK